MAVLGAVAGVAFGAGSLVGASERQPDMEQMDPDAMMRAMANANQLTEQHEHFKDMVGVWDGVLTAEVPGGEPFQTTGVMTNEVVMGGRFLRGTWQGEFMGEPFTGVSLMGYSSLAGEFQGVWYDSTANQISYTTGEQTEEGTLVMHGEETDPASGMTLPYKDILRHIDADHTTFERVYVTPQGDVPGFKIEYTRR